MEESQDKQEIQSPEIANVSQEDVQNYNEFVSLAQDRAQLEPCGQSTAFTAIHEKALQKERGWLNMIAVEAGEELCISCWSPLESNLTWNRGMFRLFGHEVPKSSVQDQEDDDAELLTLFRGGDLTCTTNRLTSGTRSHFYSIAKESVRLGTDFECLHELYCFSADRKYGPQLVLNHARNCDGIWIGVIQAVSSAVLENLRDDLEMGKLVQSFLSAKNSESINAFQIEFAFLLELTQLNTVNEVVQERDDDDDYDDDDDCGGDDSGDSVVSSACRSPDPGNSSTDTTLCSCIPGKVESIERLCKTSFQKMYLSRFPQSINTVLVAVRRRWTRVSYYLGQNEQMTINIPILGYQRALSLLLERIGFLLATDDSACYITYELLSEGEGEGEEDNNSSGEGKESFASFLRTHVSAAAATTGDYDEDEGKKMDLEEQIFKLLLCPVLLRESDH